MPLDRKIRILTISDHQLSTSGVAGQSRYICEALLKTGKYQITSLGGAIQHEDPRPVRFHEFGDDWVIYPVEGYGNPDIIRSVLRNFRPDILWFMTDPRFYVWLWNMENEIRPLVPMVYYHVWDNYPYPKYNKVYYKSTDFIASISKVTSDIVKTISSETEEAYVPHAVNSSIFKRLPEDTISQLKKDNFNGASNKMVFFWNNRNARRKQSGTLIWWFKEFLDRVGHDKCCLLMHTDPRDVNGQDLYAIISELGLNTQGQVLLSTNKASVEQISAMYNMADCTISISDAEGFGLGLCESLSCETPVIATMTGGMQEQVSDMSNLQISQEFVDKRNNTPERVLQLEHGIGIIPASSAVIGSQPIPYIYEDRINKEDFIKALMTFYNSPKELRQKWGKAGREYMIKNYNFDNFNKKWDEIMTHVYKKNGSWDTRKNYKSYELITF